MVVVVEDHEGLRVSIGRLLRAAGYEVALFESAEAFLAAPPAVARCLLLDIRLPGMSGVELQRYVRAHRSTVPIILTTADRSLADCAEQLGCDALLMKPVASETLLATIESFVHCSHASSTRP